MKILTSSYRAYRPAPARVPVVASLGLPRDMPEAASWPRCWLITPRWAWWKLPHAKYDRLFVDQLERYGAKKIARVLHQIGREHHADELVVLCFEATPEPVCHRGLYASWWFYATGETVPELDPRRTA